MGEEAERKGEGDGAVVCCTGGRATTPTPHRPHLHLNTIITTTTLINLSTPSPPTSRHPPTPPSPSTPIITDSYANQDEEATRREVQKAREFGYGLFYNVKGDAPR